MGGAVIDIYCYPRVNPVTEIITDNKTDNTGSAFEEFLRKQIESNHRVEQRQGDSCKSEARKELSTVNLLALQYVGINALFNKEAKKATDLNKQRDAARAYGF